MMRMFHFMVTPEKEWKSDVSLFWCDFDDFAIFLGISRAVITDYFKWGKFVLKVLDRIVEWGIPFLDKPSCWGQKSLEGYPSMGRAQALGELL